MTPSAVPLAERRPNRRPGLQLYPDSGLATFQTNRADGNSRILGQLFLRPCSSICSRFTTFLLPFVFVFFGGVG